MIRVKRLKKNYGRFEALKSISFEVREGSIFGFIGRNGAGKTTTMNILTGLIGFDGGDISIMGKDFVKNRQGLISHIGYLPETPAFYDYMNSYEYLGLMAAIAGHKTGDSKRRIQQLLEMVALKKDAARKIGGYSRGMKQRLALAVAVLDRPSILFLDEPSSALDPEGRLEMMGLIDTLKHEKITIFLSTHILNDAERVCDTISIIDEGKILLTERLEELHRRHMHPIFDIEFEQEPEYESMSLKRLGWVDDVNIMGKKLSVRVNDMDRAKKEILRELIRSGNNIVSYQVRKMKLEDIFIGMVNRDAHI